MTQNQIDLIENTLIGYFENPRTLGFNTKTKSCVYKAPNGNKCAVGKLLNPRCKDYTLAIKFTATVKALLRELPTPTLLLKQARDIPVPVLTAMQRVHDGLAFQEEDMESRMSGIKRCTEDELPTLTKAYDAWLQRGGHEFTKSSMKLKKSKVIGK